LRSGTDVDRVAGNLQQLGFLRYSDTSIPRPDLDRGGKIAAEREFDFLAWIIDAELAMAAFFYDDPPMGELLERGTGEADDCAASGELLAVDKASKVVHEEFDVEFVIIHLAAGPAGPIPLYSLRSDRARARRR